MLLQTFSWEFPQIFQSSFFKLPGDSFRITKRLGEAAIQSCSLNYLETIHQEVLCQLKFKKKTPPQTFWNSYSNIFERMYLHKWKPSRRLSHIISEIAVHAGVLLLGKIKVKYTTTDVFQEISLNLSEQLL